MSKIAQILSLFEREGHPDGTGSKHYQQMLQPYIMEACDGKTYVCATDAHALIMIPFEYFCDAGDNHQYLIDSVLAIGSELGLQSAKIIEAITPQTRVIHLDAIDSLLKEVRMTDEVIYEDGECPVCDGSGQVEWEYAGHKLDANCPECDGTCISEVEKQTGKLVPDYKHSLASLNTKNGQPYYSCEQLKRILDACRLSGGTELVLHEKMKIGVDFMITTGEYPGIRITAMPVLMSADAVWDASGEYQIYANVGDI